MAISLPPLPYAKNALEPLMSAETLEFHHGKHHAAYVNKANELLPGTRFEHLSIEDIIRQADGVLFNQVAQVYNHTFFWSCLKPQGGGAPTGRLAELIARDFGSFDAFKAEFTKAATGQFGSGWAWLVQNADGRLSICTTSNAGCPLRDGLTPILTLDVWEHAYYIDYRNARPRFIEAFWSLVNWDFPAAQLA